MEALGGSRAYCSRLTTGKTGLSAHIPTLGILSVGKQALEKQRGIPGGCPRTGEILI